MTDSTGRPDAADRGDDPQRSTEERAKPEKKLEATLVKGFAVLQALALADGPLGISALSSQLDIGKSNVHRLLVTMTMLGYVQKEAATRQYSPTLKAWELGAAIARRNPLVRAAKPVMQALHEETGEAVYMSTLSGTDVLYLEKLESSRGAKSPSRIGLRMPAVTTASGKVLLAHRCDSRDLVEAALAKLPNDARVTLDALLAEFEEIRSRGFAVSDSGWIRGVNALSVAIPNGRSPPLGAIGISVLPHRYTLDELIQLAPRLFNSAAEIASTIGNRH